MSKSFNKRTAVVDLFKTDKSPRNISKGLKVNRMLVWRTIKMYKKTGKGKN